MVDKFGTIGHLITFLFPRLSISDQTKKYIVLIVHRILYSIYTGDNVISESTSKWLRADPKKFQIFEVIQTDPKFLQLTHNRKFCKDLEEITKRAHIALIRFEAIVNRDELFHHLSINTYDEFYGLFVNPHFLRA